MAFKGLEFLGSRFVVSIFRVVYSLRGLEFLGYLG